MRLSNELKSGVVIVAAVAVAFVFFGKTTTFRQSTYEIKTSFVYAGDLKADAIVKLTGIEAGRLVDIKFIYEPETRVECTLELDSSAQVRKDAVAYIGTAGFVGDAYIGITTGKSKEFCAPGDSIASEDPIQMRELMKKADSIVVNLDDILVKVKALVSDNRKGIDDIVSNVEEATENLKEFSEDVKNHPWKLLFKGE